MATLPSPIPVDLAELIAQRLRVVGDPTRIRLLDALRGGGLSVGELTDALAIGQQNASKHLGVLHHAGILARHKEGTSVRYSIADATVFALCESVCGGIQAQLSELTALMESTSLAEVTR